MVDAANAGDVQTDVLAGTKDLLLIHMAIHFCAIEAGRFDGFHLVEHGTFDPDGAPHDSFFYGTASGGGALRLAGFGSEPGGAHQGEGHGGGTLFDEIAPIHELRGE